MHFTTPVWPDPTEPFGTTRRTLRLIEACVLGNALALRHWLGQGVDPNAATSCGYAPLHFAALAGRQPIVEILLEAGADPLLRGPSGCQPAELAAMHGHRATAALLRDAARQARGLREREAVLPGCLSRPAQPLIPTRAAA